MSKAIASVALVVAVFFNALGNFWYTYGIWPKSWWSFALFTIMGITIQFLFDAIKKEK